LSSLNKWAIEACDPILGGFDEDLCFGSSSQLGWSAIVSGVYLQ